MAPLISRCNMIGFLGSLDPCYHIIGPSSNKKLFPVHRPGGLKRAHWNFSFHLFNFFFLNTFPPVHSSSIKLKLGKKKKIPTSRLAFFSPTRPTGNDFLLKGGLMYLTAFLNNYLRATIKQSPHTLILACT